jgi:hypothetical protein
VAEQAFAGQLFLLHPSYPTFPERKTGSEGNSRLDRFVLVVYCTLAAAVFKPPAKVPHDVRARFDASGSCESCPLKIHNT